MYKLSGRGICGQQTELGVKGLHFTNLSRTPQCLLKFPQVTVWHSRNWSFLTPNKGQYIVSIYRVQFLWSMEVMERLHQQLKSNHAFLIAFINIVFRNSLILYWSNSETVNSDMEYLSSHWCENRDNWYLTIQVIRACSAWATIFTWWNVCNIF